MFLAAFRSAEDPWNLIDEASSALQAASAGYELKKLAFALGTALPAMACQGQTSPEAHSVESHWEDALQTLASGSDAIMAPQFVRAPEDGTMLRIVLQSGKGACERYSSETERGDFWYLSVELGAPDPGDYSIATDIDEGLPRSQRRTARVRLSEIREGRTQRTYDAPAGTVTLEAAPADAGAWRSPSATARGRVEALFSLAPRRQLECSGGASGPIVETSCECIDDAGELTTCVPVAGENCCVGAAPYLQWNADFEAINCPGLCASVAGTNYCEPLP